MIHASYFLKYTLQITVFLCLSGIVYGQQPPCGTNNPAPGNACIDAPFICNLDGYCGTTLSSYSADTWGTQTSSIFTIGTGLLGGFTNVSSNDGCGTGATIENNSFLKFVADAPNVDLGLWVGNCINASWMSGIQFYIFQLDDICGQGSVTNIYCDGQFSPTSSSQTISLSGLTAGETYYIMIDGFEGDVCDYTFTAESGISVGISADIDPNTFLCSGQSITVQASGGSGNYSWSGGLGLSDTTGTSVVITPPAAPGTYNYSVTSSDTNACTGSSDYDFSITVSSSGTPTFTNPGPVCSGATFTLPNISENGISGTWSPAVNTSATTVYTYTPDDTTCTSSMTMTVVVGNQVTPTFINPGPICSGNAFTLSTTSDNGAAGTWSPAINNTATTTYTFTPYDTTCTSLVTMTVVVENQITPAFVNPGPLCLGNSFVLSTVSDNGVPGTWSPAINDTVTVTYTFTPDDTLCTSAVSMTVVIEDEIVPEFTNPGPICSGTSFSLPTVSSNGVTGNWSPSIDNTQSTTYTFTPDLGCAVSVIMDVQVNPSPNASMVTSILSGEVPLDIEFENTSTNSTNFTWNFGNGEFSSSSDTYLSMLYNEVGTYEVILIASNGACIDTATTTIVVIESELVIHVPNVFTPNGDFVNDVFFIESNGAKTIYVEILNRWGDLMCKLENSSDVWNGGESNDGVYFYRYEITDFSDKVYTGHGYFHLIRGK